MAGLTTLHTLFAREHNRICDSLRSHPTVVAHGINWTDDDYFYNARRILIGVWQKLVYNDWLPKILGQETMNYFATGGASIRSPPVHGSSFYNLSLSPQITNNFAGAAFRQAIFFTPCWEA